MFEALMHQVSSHYEKKLPFVIYRKPKENTVAAVFQKDAQVHHVTDFTESGFVFAPFDSNEPNILMLADDFVEVSYAAEHKPFGTLDQTGSEASDKRFHVTLVKNGITHIEKGEFQKVVLSRRAEVDCASNPLELFQSLLSAYDNALCYLWYHPKIGTWLGATPEILLKVENRTLTTMSLAGTQKFEGDLDPKWGKKELEEQELVTKYISNALANKVSVLKISPRETIKAGNLLHLRTKLVATIESGALSRIVSALHPTPAVCGMPMQAAKNFILQNENYNRQYYTGYLGELNFKNELKRPSRRKNQEQKAYKTIKATTTLFVNLRCMQLKNQHAEVYVGGGVTKDSDPEREWHETVAKANTMLQVIHSV